jgi:hypothetical protein
MLAELRTAPSYVLLVSLNSKVVSKGTATGFDMVQIC